MTLVSALRDALRVPHPHESQQRVHELIARQLQDLTPGTHIRSTGYFNHSWAPDLVMRRGDVAERAVFLRFDVEDASFEQDLVYLASEKPVFMDLKASNPFGSSEGKRVDVRAALSAEPDRAEVLVTEAPAIDTLDESADADSEVRIATQKVVLGGHGYVDNGVAESIVDSWAHARDAARETRSEDLRAALDSVERYLNRVAALDIEADLRARWVAAGQEADTFPGREDWSLSDRAPWEIAALVLALVDQAGAVSAKRWDDVAQATSASDLGHELYRLGQHHYGHRVNELMAAALPYWTAQYAYAPPLESDSMERFDWSFGDYSFAINLINRRAYFTDLGKKWNRVPRSQSLPDARARLALLTDPNVLGVGLVTSEEKVSVELRPTATESLGLRLQNYLEQDGDAAWRAARITTMELRVPGTTATATIDFGRSVVRASQAVPLATFVRLVAKFVAALQPDELEQLERAWQGV